MNGTVSGELSKFSTTLYEEGDIRGHVWSTL